MMDDVDQRLLAELRRDGRASLSDLAERLDLSRATVRARMERLTARGEIAGFTVLTRSDVTAAAVRGLMMIGIEGRGTEKITARLTGIPAVLAVHSTNGKWDLIADCLEWLPRRIHGLHEARDLILDLRFRYGVFSNLRQPALQQVGLADGNASGNTDAGQR